MLLTRKLLRDDAKNKIVGVKCSVYFEPENRSLREISAAISRFGIDCGDTGVLVEECDVLPADNLVNVTFRMNASSREVGDGPVAAALSKAVEAFVEAFLGVEFRKK